MADHDPLGDLDALLDRTRGRAEIFRTLDGRRRVLVTYAAGEVDGFGDSAEEAIGALCANAEKRREPAAALRGLTADERLVADLGASVAVNDYRRDRRNG